MADGELIFDARLNGSGFSKDAGKFGDILKGLGVFEIIKKGLSMVTSSIDAAVSRYDTLNRFPKIMEQMGYGADQSGKAIQKLSDGIQGLPTTLDGIVSNTRQLAIATNSLETGVDSALALNNAFYASGATSEDAARGMIQYTQMLSSGKVDMQSWRTLNETMTYALQKTAESFGFAGASAKQDLYAALRDGDITFTEFNARIIQLNEGVNGFAEIAKTATGGIGTAMTNLKTRTVMGVTAIIDAFDCGLSQTRFKSIENVINNTSTSIKNGLKGVASVVEFTVTNMVPLTVAFVSLGVAVKGVQFLSMVGQLGKVSSAVIKLLPSIVATTAAKSKDAAATIWLTAAYAQDAIAKGLSTTATLANAAASKLAVSANNGNIVALIAYNAATMVATAATWLWNAALAANPVGLIIVGVIALVAALTALAFWLKGGSEAYKQQKQEVEALKDRQESLNTSVQDSASAFSESISAIDGTNRAGQNLLSTLKGMVDENGNLTVSHEEAQQAINDLNAAYEGLNLSYDEETGQLSASIAEVEKYVAAKASVGKLSALDQRRVELAGQQAQIEAELAEIGARRQIIANDANLTDKQKEKLYKELDKTVAAYGETQDALSADIQANNAAIEASTDSMAQNTVNAFEAINGARTSDGKNLKQLAKQYSVSTESILADMAEQGITMEEWATRKAASLTSEGMNIEQLAAKWGMSTDQVTAYMNEWGMSLDEFSQEMDATHTKAGLSLEQLAAKWGVSTDEIRNQMAMQNLSLQEWSDQQDAKTQEVINSFKEIPKQYEMTADQMIQVLQTNAERYSAWTENIATLSQTMSAEAIAELKKLGPEANSAIEEMIADPEKAAAFEDSILAVMSAGASGAEVGATDPRFPAAGAEIGAGIGVGIETSPEAETAATQLIANVATAAETAVASGAFSTVGQKIAQEIVNGVTTADMSGIATGITTAIQSGATSGSAALNTMKTQFEGQFISMNTSVVNIIQMMMLSLVSGITTRVPNVKSAGSQVATGFGQALNPMVASADGIASQAMSAFVNKLNSMSGQIWASATYIGAQTVQGMISGMDAHAAALYAKADSLAAEVINRLNRAFDIHSPAKVTIQMFRYVVMGMIGGFDKEEGHLFNRVDDLAGGVLDRLQTIPEGMAAALNQKLRVAIDANQMSLAAIPAVASASVMPAGNVTNIYFDQTNISPKHLSPSENSREADALLRRIPWKIK